MICNIEEIKSRLNAEDVLKFIGYPQSSPYRSGEEIRDFCPIHGGDNQRSLAINEKTGAFTCHSCGVRGGDLVDLYICAKKLDRQRDFIAAIEQLADCFGIGIIRDEKSAGFLGSRSPRLKSETFQEKSMDNNEKLAKSRIISAEIWLGANEEEGYPYFKKKSVEVPLGVRYIKASQSVVVPYRDTEGTIQAIQYINEKGKYFAKGTAPNGAFFSFGLILGSTVIYICEGMATAASIWLSQNKAITTISCGSCWNLPKVIAAIKRKYPELGITVCLDDNKAAEQAARKIVELKLTGIYFRRPDFDGIKGNGDRADFNDLHRLAGIDVVKEQLQKNYSPSSREKSLDLKPLSELPTNYLIEKPPEKPQLLYWLNDKGEKRAFLHKEIVAILIGEGGAGKTHLLALLAVSVITGIPFLTHFEIEKPGAVCFLVGENDNGDIHRLIWKVNKYLEGLLKENEKRRDGKHFGLHFEKPLEEILRYFYPFSVHGMNASFIDEKGNTTDFYNNFLDQLVNREPVGGWQLIILDPISRFAGVQAEKDNAMATQFITCAEKLSESLKGRPTILLSHHKSKAAIKGKEESGQGAGRGSSAFTDGSRWQANMDLKNREEGISLFYLSKTNFTSVPPKFEVKKNYVGIPEFEKWEKQKQ